MTGPIRDVGIVGGGILGLTLALRLADGGARVTVYERAPHLGGLASSVGFGDVSWDRFYHVILQSDTALLALLERLDLRQDVRWKATGTGLFDDGRLYPVSTVKDYVLLPVLGPLAKARIAITMLRAASIRSADDLERISARRWLLRSSGRRAFDRFWAPLLRAKLGDRYEEASAAFIWAIMQRLYAARRAGNKQDLFGYVPGGYRAIFERMEKELRAAGVDIRTDVEVLEVAGRADHSLGCVVRMRDSSVVHESVIVTAPSPVAATLVPELTETERVLHQGIPYLGVVCASLLLDRPLAGYYVTNITDASIPFTGVIEMSALVDPIAFGGRTLVYLPKYVAPDDPLFDREDADIVREFTDALGGMFGGLGNVAASIVSRARYVLPVSTIGYSSRLPAMRTSVPGISIVNTAHILNGTLNANETVQLADRYLAAMFDSALTGADR